MSQTDHRALEQASFNDLAGRTGRAVVESTADLAAALVAARCASQP